MPYSIVAIGEALWDVFPGGRFPGGAPCNVAFHATQLGNRGVIVTRVGADAAGDDLVAFLRGRGVATDYVQRDASRPTGAVTVTFERGEPRFAIAEDVAWDHIATDERTTRLVREADAICVGSLAQRRGPSRDAIQRLLAEARGRALIVFDVNLRPPFVDAAVLAHTLRLSDAVKLNEEEVRQISALLNRPSLIDWLTGDVGVRMVCVTRGSNGASITAANGTIEEPGIPLRTSGGDAVGTGDAFTAVLTHQLVREAEPREILATANRYAALVATKKGAMSEIPASELAGIGL